MGMKTPVYRRAAMEQARHDANWGSIRWLAGGAVGNAEGMTLGRTIIKPGERNPRHCHRRCEEVLHVLRGRVRHSLGDEEYVLEPGDTIVIPAGVFHNAASIGEEDADLIVAFSSADRDFELEDAAEGS